MNILLIFFAFPLAVVIISAILQRLLRNPFMIAALFFAIFIIITFAAFDETFLIATLLYTVLSFVTALLVSRFCSEYNRSNSCDTTINKILPNSNSTNNFSSNISNTPAGYNSNLEDTTFENTVSSNNTDYFANSWPGNCRHKNVRRF